MKISKQKNHTLLYLSATFLLSSCAGLKPLSHEEVRAKKEQPRVNLKELSAAKHAPIVEISDEELYSFDIEEVQEVEKVESAPRRQKYNKKVKKVAPVKVVTYKPAKKSDGEFLLNYSKKHFNFWMKFFTKRDKARFQRHLKNGDKYRAKVREIFAEHGLPSDLYYVGLIESGYNSRIHSRAGAAGPWQFMKGTAKRYGLKVNSQVDERYNLVKATHAAASYFKDLYNIFGSWELALCAYNKGEYGIIRAIRKGNTRDYRELVRKKLIPRETSYYIPKVAAARKLESERNRYGFHKGKPLANLSRANVVKIRKSFSQRALAKKLGISYSTFRALNPDLKNQNIRVRSRRGLNVVLPKEYHRLVDLYSPTRRVASKAKRSYSNRGSSKNAQTYRVRKGDTLIGIARRFNTNVRTLKKMNNLRNDKIRFGQRLKVKSAKQYVVRRGDNLNKIARKFNITVRELLVLNNLKNSRIYPRQRLHIPL